MKYFYSIISTLFLSNIALSQNPTQKIVDRTTDAMTMKNSVVLNNTIYTVGRSENNTINQIYPTLTIQDLDLNVQYITLPHLGPGYIDRYEVVWNIVKTSDGNLMLSGTNGELGNSAMFYYKMDPNFNFLWYKEIRTGTWGNQLTYVSVANNIGGALLAGTENGGSPTLEAQLVNVDSNGDTLWTRKVTNTDNLSMWGGANGVYVNQTGNFVAFLRHGDGTNLEMLELDQSGNVIDNFQYIDSDGFIINANDVVYANNANYYCGYRGGGNYEAVVLKTDLSGNVIWCKKYWETGDFSKIHLSDNGDLILYGNPTWGINKNKTEAFKLDTDGNVIKAVSYGKLPETQGLSSDILEINNHYYISGTRRYQTASTGFQLCLDDSLNSNSCYQYEFPVYSSDITVSKTSVNTSIVSSMQSDILSYGTPSGAMQIYSTPFFDYSLNNSIVSNINIDNDNCGGACVGTAEVMSTIGGTSPYSYSWSDGQIGDLASGLCADNEVVLLTGDQLGCFIQDTVIVGQSAPTTEICMVTVDTTSSMNEIVWSKPVSGAIEGFGVYREVVGNYNLIGYVDYDSLSRFVDNTNGVNPNITSYRYKISTFDTCGNESALSDYHETIHLTVNQGAGTDINCIWDGYEGFPFSYNRILRDSTGTGDWEVVDSVSSSVFTWTDVDAPTVPSRYIVEIVIPNNCDATKAISYGSTRSNKQSIFGGADPLSLSENETLSKVKVYPNPTKGNFWFEMVTESPQLVTIELIDVTGKTILKKELQVDGHNKNMLEMNNVDPAVYLLKISTTNSMVTKTIIKN